MWLKNTRNDTYYPYSEFLSKHSGMIIVKDNPFVPNKAVEPVLIFDGEPVKGTIGTTEEIVEEEIKESEVIPEVIIKKEILAPKKVVKRPVSKKPKTAKQVKK